MEILNYQFPKLNKLFKIRYCVYTTHRSASISTDKINSIYRCAFYFSFNLGTKLILFQYILGLFPTSSQRQLHRQCSRPRLRGWCLTSSWGLQLPPQSTQQMPRSRPRLSWRWWRDMMACKWIVQITLNDLPANRCTKCIYPEYNPATQQEIVHSY